MLLNTYANLTITYGNLTFSAVKGDITFEVPNDMVNVELDARGKMNVGTNVQGLQRNIVVNVEENSTEDKFFRAVLDAQNKPSAQNQNLIGLPLSIVRSRSDGFLTYGFLNALCTSRKKQDDILYSADGSPNQSRVLYAFFVVSPFFATESTFTPL